MKDKFNNGKHNYQDIGIERLRNAVVMQAVKDYKNDKKQREECERFFLSQYFTLFSDLDGEVIVKALKERIEKNERNSHRRNKQKG